MSVLVGLTTGVMELAQIYRLKHKVSPQRGPRLPSLEWLQQTGVRSVYASFLLLALGLLTGVILNLVNGQFPWNDPTVLRFSIVVVWQTAAATFVLVYRPARQGRKVAYITIATAVVLMVSVSLGHILPSAHGAPSKEKAEVERPGADARIAHVDSNTGRRSGPRPTAPPFQGAAV